MDSYMGKLDFMFVLGAMEPAGAEKQTYNLAVGLKRRGYRVGVLYIKPIHDLLDQCDFDVFDYVECLYAKKYFSLKALMRFKNILKKINVEKIVSVNQYSLLYCGLILAIINSSIKHVQVYHSTIPRSSKEKLMLKFIYSYFFNRLDMLVYVSKNQEKYWRDKGWWKPEKINTVLNGVNLRALIDDANGSISLSFSEFLESKSFIVGVNAALRTEKRHVDVVSAIRIVKDLGYNVGLFFLGDGKERNNLEAKIEELGLNDTVYFCGHQKNIASYASSADLFVLASDSVETFSLSILEAMALGKPVVATDIGGANEQVIPGETGSLIEARSPEKLADELSKYLSGKLDSALLGEKARLRFDKYFTEDRMIENYVEILKDL